MGAGKRVLLCWIIFVCRSVFASAEQKTITAESGQNVILTCRAPNNNIIVVEWSRADLEEGDYVLLYRDGHFVSDYQHPSFKNRVDLQDRRMKDGDVSLILKDVTVSDTGTYECRVVQTRTKRWRRALLKTAPINSTYLRVSPPPPPPPPPGPGGGATEDEEEEDGGKQDGVSRAHYGLVAPGLFLLLVAALLIAGKLQKKNSSHLPSNKPADSCSET